MLEWMRSSMHSHTEHTHTDTETHALNTLFIVHQICNSDRFHATSIHTLTHSCAVDCAMHFDFNSQLVFRFFRPFRVAIELTKRKKKTNRFRWSGLCHCNGLTRGNAMTINCYYKSVKNQNISFRNDNIKSSFLVMRNWQIERFQSRITWTMQMEGGWNGVRCVRHHNPFNRNVFF